MTLYAKLILFASSYAPLMAIWALVLWDQHRWIAVATAAFAALSVGFLVYAHRWARSLSPDRLTTATVDGRDGEAMSYIVTYLLPFLGLQQQHLIELIAMFMVLLVLAILYVNSNMIYTNPVINLFGYHLFCVESQSGKQVMVVTKRDYIGPGEILDVRMVGNFVGLEN